MEIKRAYDHRGGKTNPAFGHIADVVLTVPEGEWTLDGKVIHNRGVEHFVNFCLQSLQDVYAGASDHADAVAKFNTKRDKIIAGTIGVGGGGVTSHESEIYRLAYAAFKTEHGKEKAKALREKIGAEQQIVLKAFMGKKFARYFDDATESLKRKAIEAQESAQRAADIANEDDDNDFNLDDFDL